MVHLELWIYQRIKISIESFLSMVHLEPWIYQWIETSNRSIFHVSPRIMAGPISSYENWKSKRVHRQLQQRTSNRDKNKSTGYAHGYTYQDQDLKFLQNTQNDSNSYHRTHRASLLLDRTKQPPIVCAYYYKNDVFFTKTFLPKELATDHAINTCILVKFLKLQRVPSSNKRENTIQSSLVSIKDTRQPSLGTGTVHNTDQYARSKKQKHKITFSERVC